MTNHGIIPGWFTREQRGELTTHIERLVSRPGGILLNSVEIAPDQRNYPSLTFGVFHADKRKALRAALLRAKKQQDAAAAEIIDNATHVSRQEARRVTLYRSHALLMPGG